MGEPRVNDELSKNKPRRVISDRDLLLYLSTLPKSLSIRLLEDKIAYHEVYHTVCQAQLLLAL